MVTLACNLDLAGSGFFASLTRSIYRQVAPRTRMVDVHTYSAHLSS